EILTRRKMGFGVPLGAWFRRELRDMARDVLLGAQARERGLFRLSEVESLLATHDSGRRDCSARLWSLICFELWMRQWADRGPAAPRGASDRKSTRLNSSHDQISYAVFCLK